MKILHVFNFETKFSKDYFDFLKDNDFDLSKHTLFHYGKTDNYFDKFDISYLFSRSFFSIWSHIKLLKMMFKNDRLILHNLASPWLLLYLYLFPHLNKKVYWVIWGKDLYFYRLLKKKYFYHKIYEYFRKKVFKRIENIVTFVKGDFLLAQKWYGLNAELHESFMYPSNLFKESRIKQNDIECINILVGNSADPSNNHYQLFEYLKKFNCKNIKLFLPLSYGDKVYAKKVISYGKNIFGEKLIPLVNFMPIETYNEFLESINIAVFAHKRQQAMGNTISLISLGKKVFIRSDTTSWEYFKKTKIKIFDIKQLELSELTYFDKVTNQQIIKENFSKEKLVLQLNTIFNN